MPAHVAAAGSQEPYDVDGRHPPLHSRSGAPCAADRSTHAPAELSEKAHWLTGSSSGQQTIPIEPKTKGSLEEPNGDRTHHDQQADHHAVTPLCGTLLTPGGRRASHLRAGPTGDSRNQNLRHTQDDPLHQR